VRVWHRARRRGQLLDITFVIDEGEPMRVADVSIVPLDSLKVLPVPPDERRSWSRLERAVVAQRGEHLIVTDARKAREQLTKWWRNRGYPRAAVTTA
jgi:hypothetical protein